MKNNPLKFLSREFYFSMMMASIFIYGSPQVAYGNSEEIQTIMQTNVVKGQIVDVNGEPIIGASVQIKGEQTGVISDINGNFSLSASNKSIFLISYVGYKPQEVSLNGKNFIKVTLIEDSEMLDEVVVVGFGTQKKINLTGSVGIATTKDIESRPVANAVQALQGIVPGMQITTNNGELNKSMSINIRGEGTIGTGSSGSPLILIDGMEGDLNTINPQDIENISVLKDASASSIYGSRAPFGVVLVTTKKGHAGKTSINYNNSFRFSSPMNLAHSMNSYDFANYFNSASINAGWGVIFSDNVMQKMLDFQAAGKGNTGGLPTDRVYWGKPAADPYTNAYANVDWLHELYGGTKFSQEHNLSFNGGNEKTSYYASLGYLDQDGLLNYGDDGLKRYNISAKINSEITSWLEFSYSTRFIRTDYWKPTSFGDGLYLNIGRQSWPNLPVYDENGYLYSSPTPALGLVEGGKTNTQTDQYYHQGALIMEPIKNWKTHFEFNYSTYSYDNRQVSLPTYNHDVAGNVVDTKGTSSLYQEHKKENYMNINVYSEYSRSFNEAHNFKVMAGFQSEEMKQSDFGAKAYGLLSNDLAELDLTSSTDGTGSTLIDEASGYRNEWSSAGFFGRINYDYKGKYLAEANLRYDGSSRFRIL